ncbi:MAG TPA: alpha/beta fold hydrolase [Stellaceae bacterium]|jgi:alpha-beta hydrolase superfamily lysophospholipase|nr:alpha/beta fold hydrolase [Stellaceae bacterium]
MSLARGAVLALALWLAACAGGGQLDRSPESADSAAGSPGKLTPHIEGGVFVADDGARLPLRAWLPRGRVKAVVVAIHGFNDYSQGFQGVGVQWESAGIATYAYDQRGFGEAPDRGRWVGAWRLTQDIAAMSRVLHARYPHLPVYLFGESMGGALVVVSVTGAAGAEKPAVDGIILMAPAVWGRAYMNVFERSALFLAYNIVPSMTLTGQSLGIRASDNEEALRELSLDPLFIKATRVDAIKGLVDVMDMATAAAPLLTQRALILYGAKDQLIPKPPFYHFLRSLPPVSPGLRTIAYYPEGWHLLGRDLEAATVIADMTSWIEHPDAPLPSGADREIPPEALAPQP